jgi:hypothetical protein
MSSGEKWEYRWHRCPASTRLTASESARLAALPGTVDLHGLGCELAAGHDGSHVAFTVAGSGGERRWWLQWVAHDHMLIEADPCGCTQNQAFLPGDCMLPKDHPGQHSFDIRAGLWKRRRKAKRHDAPRSAERPTRP